MTITQTNNLEKTTPPKEFLEIFNSLNEITKETIKVFLYHSLKNARLYNERIMESSKERCAAILKKKIDISKDMNPVARTDEQILLDYQDELSMGNPIWQNQEEAIQNIFYIYLSSSQMDKQAILSFLESYKTN